MKHYVLCLIQAYNTQRIIFVKKDRPEWQKGRINLVGGKVEESETFPEAVIREVREETGILANKDYISDEVGKIIGVEPNSNEPFEVHCFYLCIEEELALPKPSLNETEHFYWQNWNLTMNEPKLIQNLKTIIPLILSGAPGWILRTTSYEPYTVEVTYNECF